jgi:hypothetical protein
MTALLTVLLFGTAFAVAAWTLFTSIRPQLHRYQALFAPKVQLLPVLVPTRVTVRYSVPTRRAGAFPLRAAA